MQARSIPAVLAVAVALSACKQDPKPDKEPEPAAAPAAEKPVEKADSYQLEPPKTTTARASETSAPGAAKGEAAGQADKADADGKKGPSARGEGFEAYLAASESYQAQTKGSVTVILNAIPPFHCNDKYPYKFTVEPSSKVNYAQDVVRDMKVGESRSTMTVDFTPTGTGKQTIKGTLAFSVCTDDKCLIEKQPLSVTVDVKGAS